MGIRLWTPASGRRPKGSFPFEPGDIQHQIINQDQKDAQAHGHVPWALDFPNEAGNDQNDAAHDESLEQAGHLLERKHREFTHQQERKDNREYGDEPHRAHEDVQETVGVERIDGQRNEQQGAARSGQSEKTRGLPGVDVEFGEPEGRGGGQDERKPPQQRNLRMGDAVPRKETNGRAQAKTDQVGQRIEFLANLRIGAQRPGRKAVEEVEELGNHQANQHGGKVPPHCKNNPCATCEQVAQGEEVRDVFLHQRPSFLRISLGMASLWTMMLTQRIWT